MQIWLQTSGSSHSSMSAGTGAQGWQGWDGVGWGLCWDAGEEAHRHRSLGPGVGSQWGKSTQSRVSGRCRCGSSRHCCADTHSGLGRDAEIPERLGSGQGQDGVVGSRERKQKLGRQESHCATLPGHQGITAGGAEPGLSSWPPTVEGFAFHKPVSYSFSFQVTQGQGVRRD